MKTVGLIAAGGAFLAVAQSARLTKPGISFLQKKSDFAAPDVLEGVDDPPSEEFYNVASAINIHPEQVDELRTKVAGLMVNEMTVESNPKSPLEGANGDHPAFSTTTPVVAAKVVTTTTAVHTPTVINAAPTTVVAHAAVPVVHIAHALPVVHVVRGGTGFLDKDKKAEPTAQKAEAGKK